jgi:uncharacterized protein
MRGKSPETFIKYCGASAVDSEGWNALMYSAAHGKDDPAKELIKAGIDVEARNHDGSTALHIAASAGRLEMVSWLISTGKASVEARDGRGRTALILAVEAGWPDVAERLIKRHACRVNAKDDEGRTAYLIAKDSGHEALLELLVSARSRMRFLACACPLLVRNEGPRL